MASRTSVDDKALQQKLVDPDAFSDVDDDDHHPGAFKSAAGAAAAARRQKRRRNLAAFSLGALPMMLFILLYSTSTSPRDLLAGGLFPNLQQLESKPQLFHILPNAATREMDPVTGKFPPRKAIVIASYKNQKINWIPDAQRLLPEWEIFRYESDANVKQLDDDYDADYEGIETHKLSHPDGREPLAFVTFVLENYAKLPDYIAFVHGHRHSWHQPEHIVDVLMTLNLTAVDDEKFINFRCESNHGCTEETYFYMAEPKMNFKWRGGNHLGPFWDDIMRPIGLPELPPVIGRRCCAQFAVPKDAILNRSYQAWEHFASPLMKRPRWGGKSPHTIGLYYESLWHIMFGRNPIHCPSEDRCHDVHFSGKLRCSCKGILPCYRNGTHLGWNGMPCQNDLRKTKLDSHWKYMKWFENKYPPWGNITNPWEVEYPEPPGTKHGQCRHC